MLMAALCGLGFFGTGRRTRESPADNQCYFQWTCARDQAIDKKPSIAPAGTGRLPLKPGWYVGPWVQPSGTHWLVFYFDTEGQQALMYEPPAALRLCAFTVFRDTVRFQSPPLMIRTAGIPYRFRFVGKISADGLRGRVTVLGGLDNGEQDTVSLHWFQTSMDSTAAAANEQGQFSSVRENEASGDLVGDELLIVNTAEGPIALYSLYAGAPLGPFPVDSLKLRGDTVSGRVTLGREPQPITWILDRAKSESEPLGPRHLHAVGTIRQWLDPSNSQPCPAMPEGTGL